MATRLRRSVGAVLTLVLVALTLGGTAGTAHAADSYRYWSYFHVAGGRFVFAKTGPGDYTPAADAIEGYRYGTSTSAKGLAPRADLGVYTIGTICAGVKPGPGQKRVGVLIDYGTAADAGSGQTPPKPRAACAVVPVDANGQQVLAKVAATRVKGFLCGVDGYPVSTCSVTVKDAAAPGTERPVAFALPAGASARASAAAASGSGAATPEPSTSSAAGSSTTVLVGTAIVVVLLVVGGGVALNRRTRNG